MADENEEPEATEKEEGGGGGKKKLILFGGIGLLVVVLGAGAFMFMGSGNKKEMAAKDPAAEGSEESADGEATSQESTEAEGEGEKKEGEENEEKKPEKDDEDEDANIDFGQTYAFKTFHLNLGNPLENRFMRMEVSLEYKGGETHKKEIEARIPQLRDAIVNVASRKTREFLLGPDGKDQLRLEMLNRINQYMDRKIETVFITDILIE